MPEYEPTHSLLIRSDVEGTSDHQKIVVGAFEAAAEAADEARFRIDWALAPSDRSAMAERFDETFDRSESGGATTYRSRDVAAAVDELESIVADGELLWHAARELELAAADERILQYVPEHHKFTVDDETAPGIADAVAETIVGDSAVIVPSGAIVEWEFDGATFSVGTSVCRRSEGWLVRGRCYHLTRLQDVEPNAEARTIDLIWDLSDRGPIGSAIGAAAKALGWSRPGTLHFESTEDFEVAREVLEAIVAGFEGERVSV